MRKRCQTVLIDSHCHVFMPDFDLDRSDVLARAAAAGVTGLVLVGYDLESSHAAVSFAEREPEAFACVAIHPHRALEATPEALADLRQLATHPKVVAIGETGLDFYRLRSPKEDQEQAFRTQLQLARELRLPVVIHDREAHGDTMRILAEEAGSLPGVILHCFSGDRAMAVEAWGRGYYTAVGGPLTYANAGALRELVRMAPRDRILLETDAPYLPPAPHRGERNEPSYLPLIRERLASLWDTGAEHAAEVTALNTRRAFALPGMGGTA